MGLIRFIFRIVVNLVGAVLILLLVGTLLAWFRGRWTSEELVVSWVQHAPDGRDLLHETQIVLGNNFYVNDTEKLAAEEIADATTQPSTQPTTQPAVAKSSVEVNHIKRNTLPGSIPSAGPGTGAKFAALGFEYGDRQNEGEDRYRWVLAPYWLLGLLFAVPVALWMFVYSRTRRYHAMTCTSCHHDLRQPIRRCPECGATLARPLKIA